MTASLILSSVVEMNHSNNNGFDGPALYAALDAQRQAYGLSWQQVAKRIGVAASTLGRTKKGGPMETDGILAMVRWLKCAPENFIRGSQHVTYEAPSVAAHRFNTKALYEALDAHRRSRGMSWREVARELGNVSCGMLTHLSKGGRVDINVVVATVRYLGRGVLDFTRASVRMTSQPSA